MHSFVSAFRNLYKHVQLLSSPTVIFQSLIMNDQCPVQYVTYNQTSAANATSEDEQDDDGYFQ